jgi:hypothetical protein
MLVGLIVTDVDSLEDSTFLNSSDESTKGMQPNISIGGFESTCWVKAH